jgi:glycosyltransferase involved in cell wall biosynthesis
MASETHQYAESARGPLASARRITGTRVRLYQTVRTAHLERAHDLAPATIVFGSRRYDFEADLTSGLELIQASPARAALLLATSGVTELEINEPLMRSSARATTLALAALRLRELFGGPPITVVAYAIGNDDPTRGRLTPWKRLSARLDLALMRFVWRRVDRIAYGTHAARATYQRILGSPPPRQAETLIEALPAACSCLESSGPRDPRRVVFLGAFVERKGFPLVLEAWPLVRAALPGARLTILGKGRLQALAERAALADDSIDLVIDPPRTEIHRRLAESRVLSLPSQPSPHWREQVGLPIVEGLSHGCSVVTTTETGLAAWLHDHGHEVVDTPTTAAALAEALVAGITSGPEHGDVVASLPPVDGRLAADEWMFAGAAVPPVPSAASASPAVEKGNRAHSA